MYTKRKTIGNFWPVPRKGTKYLAVSTHNKKNSIPLLVVMRDILQLVNNKKELKKIINEKQVVINGKEIRETNYPISLLDVLSLKGIKKNFRALFSEYKKLAFEEISDKDAQTKTFKVIGKKVLKGNKVQVNLLHGRNVFVKDKVDVDDSVVYNFKEDKVEKVVSIGEEKMAYVIKGKHMGDKGKILEIVNRGGKKLVKIDAGEKVNVWVKNIIVM